MEKRCKECDEDGARTVLLEATLGQRRRMYVLVLCRRCWRVLEAMIEGPKQSEQHHLFGTHYPGLFLW